MYTGNRPWENDVRNTTGRTIKVSGKYLQKHAGVTFPYDVDREQRRRENLIANRGSAPTEPTTTTNGEPF